MFQISLCLYKQREGIVGRAVLQSPEVKGLNWLRRVRVHDLIRQHARPSSACAPGDGGALDVGPIMSMTLSFGGARIDGGHNGKLVLWHLSSREPVKSDGPGNRVPSEWGSAYFAQFCYPKF